MRAYGPQPLVNVGGLSRQKVLKGFSFLGFQLFLLLFLGLYLFPFFSQVLINV